MPFSVWKFNNLSIKLTKSTSILNITYKDKDKSIIIPVLEKISKTYQQYTNKSKEKSLNFSRIYLEKQVDKYKLKSSNSLKKTEEYAINENLLGTLPDQVLGRDIVDSSNYNFKNPQNYTFSGSILGIEKQRIELESKIKQINLKIKKIDNVNIKNTEVLFIAKSIEELVNTGLIDEITSLEKNINDKQFLYRADDPKLLLLKKRLKYEYKNLRNQSLLYLKAQRDQLQFALDTFKRPKEVLIKYRELIREAKRDESALLNFETELMKTNLQLSKLDDPWELISQPTLFYKHIAPRGSKYALLGIISGIISGILTSIYKELKDKSIFENNILETMLQSKILKKINLEDGSFTIHTKEILFDEIIQFKNDVKFLPTNKIKKESINKFQNSI